MLVRIKRFLEVTILNSAFPDVLLMPYLLLYSKWSKDVSIELFLCIIRTTINLHITLHSCLSNDVISERSLGISCMAHTVTHPNPNSSHHKTQK